MNKETFAFEYRVKASTSKWERHVAKFSSQDLAQLFENVCMQQDFLSILEETGRIQSF